MLFQAASRARPGTGVNQVWLLSTPHRQGLADDPRTAVGRLHSIMSFEKPYSKVECLPSGPELG
jgi:hypothetical protein